MPRLGPLGPSCRASAVLEHSSVRWGLCTRTVKRWPNTYSADPDTASLLAAKEQRISELRAALSSLLSDKGALQRELAAAREEAAAAAVAAHAASSAAAAAAAEQQERKLQDNQVGLANSFA